MQNQIARPRPLLRLLPAALLTGIFIYWWFTLPLASDPAPFFGEALLHRAAPPPDVAIELTGDELAALTEAYESGFDHPDPEGGDPCRRLRLLPYKKLSAWRRQFRKRGFTVEKVKDILQNGRREPYLHPEKGTTYTKIYDPQGNWIVVDFVDCLLWQVAPHNFK